MNVGDIVEIDDIHSDPSGTGDEGAGGDFPTCFPIQVFTQSQGCMPHAPCSTSQCSNVRGQRELQRTEMQ